MAYKNRKAQKRAVKALRLKPGNWRNIKTKYNRSKRARLSIQGVFKLMSTKRGW